ncbi:MAG: hypothetical protein WBP64_12930 [Nitrososphaeraceae archaeon]
MTVESLKKRIRKHYYNELKIMSDMIDGDYSTDELNDLQQFMSNHPYVKFVDVLREKANDA